jgi:hypothetical protein
VVTVEELAFQGGEEALGDGVVECVADGAHRGDQTGLTQPTAEGEAGVLAAVVAVVDQARVGLRWVMAMSRASRTNSVRRWVAIDQPTIRRE